VTNIGELLGPTLRVEVFGSLSEDDKDLTVPKRFHADITSGDLCIGSTICVPLPISGEGIFDGVFLNEKIRIGQNINGGGAIVLQTREPLEDSP